MQRVDARVDVADAASMPSIPIRKIFLGVTARVVTHLRGAPNWQLGVPGGVNRFGSALPVTVGSEVFGPADPLVIYWTETKMQVTSANGTLSAGRIDMSLFYIDLPLPPSL